MQKHDYIHVIQLSIGFNTMYSSNYNCMHNDYITHADKIVHLVSFFNVSIVFYQ